MKKILIITQYSLFNWKRNMNAYQRVWYGAQYAEIFLLIRRKNVVSGELASRAHVHRSWVHWRPGFVIYALLYAAYLRLRGLHAVITEPSGLAVVGFAAKYLLRTTWVLDVWDRPRSRAGEHEGPPSRRSDLFVFWLMKRADLYILSVLPRAARDIDPPPYRCIQVYNALDLSQCAETPATRKNDERILRLAFSRSRFHPNSGLDVLVEAIELATSQGADLQVHLAGVILPEGEELLRASSVREKFVIHGTVASRTELFRSVHVGVVPYPPFEDLSYIFPIKILEHLSQGTPVIASDIPGLAMMIKDGYNGLLVRPGEPRSLADAMLRLFHDRSLWSELAANALVSIQEFDAENKNRVVFQRVLEDLRVS